MATGPSYCFRVPFRMSERALLDIEEALFELMSDAPVRVWLASTVKNESLRDAASIVIRGEGYISESAASEEGERWRDVVSRALAGAPRG